MNHKTLVSYAESRPRIRNADLLLFRPRNRMARAIAVAGRSEYVHAAMTGWWNGRLMCVEMTSGGGRATLLSGLVQRWPGAIDLFQSNAVRRRFSRTKTLEAMIAATGRDYGWGNLLCAAMLHLPMFRFLVSPSGDDSAASSWPPFCSQAIAAACRSGGVDPVPNLADRLTEPGDLARSPFFAYQCTFA
ncbi:MAG: hypothetical protein ABFC77_03530 [Thermoguttaceae bacterium]